MKLVWQRGGENEALYGIYHGLPIIEYSWLSNAVGFVAVYVEEKLGGRKAFGGAIWWVEVESPRVNVVHHSICVDIVIISNDPTPISRYIQINTRRVFVFCFSLYFYFIILSMHRKMPFNFKINTQLIFHFIFNSNLNLFSKNK